MRAIAWLFTAQLTALGSTAFGTPPASKGPSRGESPQAADAARMRELRARVAGSGWPSLVSVQDAAEASLRLPSDAEVRSWGGRARSRGWLPRLDVRVGTDSDLDIRAQAERDPSWTEGRGYGLDVSLRFQLGQLIFSSDELRAHRERLRRSAVVRAAVLKVTELYFERLEVELEAPKEPAADGLVQLLRLDGALDAATGGRWSQLLAESSR